MLDVWASSWQATEKLEICAERMGQWLADNRKIATLNIKFEATFLGSFFTTVTGVVKWKRKNY